MNRAKPKDTSIKPKVSLKPSRDARKKHEIPDKILKSFLNREIGLSELDNISKIRAAFLWDVEGVGLMFGRKPITRIGFSRQLKLNILFLFIIIQKNRQ